MIDHARQRYRIRGPVDAQTLVYYKYFRAERDALFARAVLARRSRTRSGRKLASHYDLIWINVDLMLPNRWQVSHDIENVLALFLIMPIRDLNRHADRYAKTARIYKILADLPEHDKDAYRFANDIMKPVLRPYGYRSLAEFDRAWNDSGGKPPWPKVGHSMK